MLSNKKELRMSHLVWLIGYEDILSNLTILQRVYELEKIVQALQDFINNSEG